MNRYARALAAVTVWCRVNRHRSIPDQHAQLRKSDHFLIRGQNAVPFDPNAGWKEGDLISDYVMSRQDAAG